MPFIFLILSALIGQNQTDQGKVIVEITNLEVREGKILLSVYDDEEGFPGDEDKAIKKMIIPISQEPCIAEIVLPGGTYAISVAHDVNDNMEVDTNWLGIPKEPLGMSNYPDMARPKFDKAKFDLVVGQTLRLEIPVNTIF